MKVTNYLVYTLFQLALLPVFSQETNPCKTIEVETEVVRSSNQSNGTAIIKFTFKDQSEYEIFLLGEGKGKNKMGIKKNEIPGVAPGKYDLIITDTRRKNVCPRHLKIEVQ
jgi:hypothetical protein